MGEQKVDNGAMNFVEIACSVYYDAGWDIRDEEALKKWWECGHGIPKEKCDNVKENEYQRAVNAFAVAKALADFAALVSGRRNNDDACRELSQLTKGSNYDDIWNDCPNDDFLDCVLYDVVRDGKNADLAIDIKIYRQRFYKWYDFFWQYS